jgi:hypothetical protein
MSVKIKSTKRQKREAVIPFDGEENFVVPRKGGFGQPDNENFVMVAGSVSGTIVGDTPRTPVGDGGSMPTDDGSGNPPPPPPPPPPMDVPIKETPSDAPTKIDIPYQDFASYTCDQLKGYLSILDGYKKVIQPFPAQLPRYNAEIANVNAAMTTACDVKVVMPEFPDFNTMSCNQLESFIKEKEAFLSVTRFTTPQIAEAHNNALATAKSLFTTKCPIVTVGGGSGGVLITPLGGGIGFPPIGGGGGGGGEEPTTTPPPTEKKNNWWWILLVIGGVYLLTRKKGK